MSLYITIYKKFLLFYIIISEVFIFFSLFLTNLPTIPTQVAPIAIDAAVGLPDNVNAILVINNKTTTPNPNH